MTLRCVRGGYCFGSSMALDSLSITSRPVGLCSFNIVPSWQRSEKHRVQADASPTPLPSGQTSHSKKLESQGLFHSSGPADHRRHSALTPAVAHHDYFRTPLSAPVQPSHQTISTRLDYVDLYGNYSVQGPAIIRKVNHALVALVQPGGLISVLSSADADPTLMSCASISHDESETALCTLMGHHLELDGRFLLHDENEGIEHDGRTIVSVDHLSDDNYITLLPGGSVSHPVNVRPRT